MCAIALCVEPQRNIEITEPLPYRIFPYNIRSNISLHALKNLFGHCLYTRISLYFQTFLIACLTQCALVTFNCCLQILSNPSLAVPASLGHACNSEILRQSFQQKHFRCQQFLPFSFLVILPKVQHQASAAKSQTVLFGNCALLMFEIQKDLRIHFTENTQ